MHSNGTVIYVDPLSADQPATVANDGAQAGDAAPAADNAGTSAGTAANGSADAAQPNTAGSIISLLLPLVLMGVVFYFFLIRPQRKKDKAVKNMLDSLKNGDRVCTIGGIYGTVDRLKDDTVTLLVGPEKTKLIMARWAIRSVENATVENDAEPEV